MAPARQSRRDNSVTEVQGTASEILPYQRMIASMANNATAAEANDSFTGDQLSGIWNAETEDDIWDADMAPPLNAQHLAGCELKLHELQVKYSRGQSDFDTPYVTSDGKKFYVMITAERISLAGKNQRLMRLPEIGERFSFNTSAAYLTAKLYTFWSRGFFGGGKSMTALIQATDLGEGQAVLKLARLASRTVPTVVATDNDERQDSLVPDIEEPPYAEEPPF